MGGQEACSGQDSSYKAVAASTTGDPSPRPLSLRAPTLTTASSSCLSSSCTRCMAVDAMSASRISLALPHFPAWCLAT